MLPSGASVNLVRAESADSQRRSLLSNGVQVWYKVSYSSADEADDQNSGVVENLSSAESEFTTNPTISGVAKVESSARVVAVGLVSLVLPCLVLLALF
jgi:hypothetical protein